MQEENNGYFQIQMQNQSKQQFEINCIRPFNRISVAKCILSKTSQLINQEQQNIEIQLVDSTNQNIIQTIIKTLPQGNYTASQLITQLNTIFTNITFTVENYVFSITSSIDQVNYKTTLVLSLALPNNRILKISNSRIFNQLLGFNLINEQLIISTLSKTSENIINFNQDLFYHIRLEQCTNRIQGQYQQIVDSILVGNELYGTFSEYNNNNTFQTSKYLQNQFYSGKNYIDIEILDSNFQAVSLSKVIIIFQLFYYDENMQRKQTQLLNQLLKIGQDYFSDNKQKKQHEQQLQNEQLYKDKLIEKRYFK